jgi:hypothetical protein
VRKSPHSIKRDGHHYKMRCARLEIEVRELKAALRKIEGFGYGPDVVVARIALGSESGKEV